MASIWQQAVKECGPGKKLAGMLSPRQSTERLVKLCADWCAVPKQRAEIVSGTMTAMLFRNGTLVGCYYIEPHSPPSAPEKGQPKREAA
jgi:hypothetical protein